MNLLSTVRLRVGFGASACAGKWRRGLFAPRLIGSLSMKLSGAVGVRDGRWVVRVGRGGYHGRVRGGRNRSADLSDVAHAKAWLTCGAGFDYGA